MKFDIKAEKNMKRMGDGRKHLWRSFTRAQYGLAWLLMTLAIITFSFLGRKDKAIHPVDEAQTRLQLNEDFGKLPLAFEINKGQTNSQVKFLARNKGYSCYLTTREAVLTFPANSRSKLKAKKKPVSGNVVRMKIVGGNQACKVVGMDKLPGISNYFIGNDPSKWRTNIAQYAKVKLVDVYPGIDLVYYGKNGKLEYDFVVKPGADPKAIKVAWGGIQAQKIENENLVLQTEGRSRGQVSQMVFKAPVVYQRTGHGQETVEGHYVVARNNCLSFQVENYDRNQDLVIDPQLDYSTYLGGTQNYGSSAGSGWTDVNNSWQDGGVAVDGSGNVYMAGDAQCVDFPVTSGAYQNTNSGVGGAADMAFVSKISPAGGGSSDLIYSTYFGGTYRSGLPDTTLPFGVKVDASGNIYIAGQTEATNLPTTSGAYQIGSPKSSGNFCIFVTKLNPSLTGTAQLVYSTYVGGTAAKDDTIGGMTIDNSGNVYVTGGTQSQFFPTTPGAYQTVYPGTPGEQTFIFELNPGNNSGADMIYSTFLGGSVGTGSGAGINLDSNNYILVTGSTDSTNFPTTSGAYQTTNTSGSNSQVYLAKINPAGSGSSDLLYSTYFGGTNAPTSAQTGSGIAADSTGNIYIAGETTQSTFPTTSGAYQTTYSGNQDIFVAKFNPSLTGSAQLVYSTLLGGNAYTLANGMVLDAHNNVYVVGSTSEPNYPTTANAYRSTNPGSLALAVLSEVNPGNNGNEDLVYSTYFGGGGENSRSVAIDSTGNIYIHGQTTSSSYPTTSGAYLTSKPGAYNAFLVKFDASAFATKTPTPTKTMTATTTTTNTSTLTATNTATNTSTGTATNTSTNTIPVTSTSTSTQTSTSTATASSTMTSTSTSTVTNTVTNSATGTSTQTSTNTRTVTSTATGTSTNTATNTVTNSPTQTSSSTVTNTVTSTATSTNISTSTMTNTPTFTATATSTNTAQPTSTATSTATVTATSAFGLNAVPSQGTCYLAPNPVTGNSALLAYNMNSSGTVTIRFYNAIGQVLAKQEDYRQSGPQDSTINLSGYAPGVYLYRVSIQYDSGQTVNLPLSKFIVAH